MFIDSGCVLEDSCQCNGDDGRCSNPIGVKVVTGDGFENPWQTYTGVDLKSRNPLHMHSNETARKREAVSQVRLVDVSMNSFDVKSVLKHRPCELHNIEQIYGH